jgi:hypothetical protein
METIRLVNTYGDVAYGKADNRVERRYTEGTSTDAYSSNRRGATGSAGGRSTGGGRSSSAATGSGGNSRTPGAYGPAVRAGGGKKVAPVKMTAPTKATVKSPTGRGKVDPAKALQAARVAAAETALKKMVGWSTANKSALLQYKVAKSGLATVLYVKGPQDRDFVLLPKTDTRWLATVAAAARAYAAEKGVKSPLPSTGTTGTTTGTTSNTTGTTSDTTGTTSDTTGTTSDTTGTSTPAWFTQPYLNEMLAVSGWKGPSYNMPGVTLEVKTITLDGVSAPAIGVTSSTGMVDVTPAMAEWTGYAANVIPSKAEDDQRKATGTPAPSTSGGGSSARVTSETTSSGYSVWSSESVPSSDGSTPTVSSGGGGSSMRVVEDAPAFAPSGEEAVAPEAVTLVSEEGATAEGEEGFLAKNKWYIAGGAVALLGGYAYMHRMNPTKYPLPDYLSKLVRG